MFEYTYAYAGTGLVCAGDHPPTPCAGTKLKLVVVGRGWAGHVVCQNRAHRERALEQLADDHGVSTRSFDLRVPEDRGIRATVRSPLEPTASTDQGASTMSDEITHLRYFDPFVPSPYTRTGFDGWRCTCIDATAASSATPHRGRVLAVEVAPSADGPWTMHSITGVCENLHHRSRLHEKLTAEFGHDLQVVESPALSRFNRIATDRHAHVNTKAEAGADTVPYEGASTMSTSTVTAPEHFPDQGERLVDAREPHLPRQVVNSTGLSLTQPENPTEHSAHWYIPQMAYVCTAVPIERRSECVGQVLGVAHFYRGSWQAPAHGACQLAAHRRALQDKMQADAGADWAPTNDPLSLYADRFPIVRDSETAPTTSTRESTPVDTTVDLPNLSLIQRDLIAYLLGGDGDRTRRAQAFAVIAHADVFDPNRSEASIRKILEELLDDGSIDACSDGQDRFREAFGLTREHTWRVYLCQGDSDGPVLATATFVAPTDDESEAEAHLEEHVDLSDIDATFREALYRHDRNDPEIRLDWQSNIDCYWRLELGD